MEGKGIKLSFKNETKWPTEQSIKLGQLHNKDIKEVVFKVVPVSLFLGNIT